MDNGTGNSKGEDKRKQPAIIPKPSSKIFFLNKELVRVLHSNRAQNICSLYNFNQDKVQNMLFSDFRKYRKKAYTVSNTLRIFKRSRMQLERWIKNGLISPPTGATVGGQRKFQKLSYYSEDDIFVIREALASIHTGRPRKDGRITTRKDIPSEKDLRSMLGEAIMLYTKTKDGRFIPVWAEETW